MAFFLRKTKKETAKKILLLFEGGNSPGYSPVAVALTEEGLRRGYEVYAAHEGFRSLTGDNLEKQRLVRLVMSNKESWELNSQGIPTRSLAGTATSPGSPFRSERYPLFKQEDKQKKAAQFIRDHHFTHLVAIGGNGTLQAIKCLRRFMDLPTGFINKSVDNDIGNDIAVGYYTATEEGAKICRGLMEDAYTHKRIYILEMMGRDSGSHALLAGSSSRAHLIILPGFTLDAAILSAVSARLNDLSNAVIVVAEGYEKDRRGKLNSAEFFKNQLLEQGLQESPVKKVITEGYSRYIRGIPPLFMEVAMASLKAHMLFEAFEKGNHDIMPYFKGLFDQGLLKFDHVTSSNEVPEKFVDIIDRLQIEPLRQYICHKRNNI